MLRISYSATEAKRALEIVIPAMASGININTHQGALALYGDDAIRVMRLVEEIAKSKAASVGDILSGFDRTTSGAIGQPYDHIASLSRLASQAEPHKVAIAADDFAEGALS